MKIGRPRAHSTLKSRARESPCDGRLENCWASFFSPTPECDLACFSKKTDMPCLRSSLRLFWVAFVASSPGSLCVWGGLAWLNVCPNMLCLRSSLRLFWVALVVCRPRSLCVWWARLAGWLPEHCRQQERKSHQAFVGQSVSRSVSRSVGRSYIHRQS